MPYFKIDYNLEYPKELNIKTEGSDRLSLYNSLRDFSQNRLDFVVRSLAEDLLRIYPELGCSDSIGSEKLKSFIFELVKNSFDSVNSKKVEHSEIKFLEIQLTVQDIGDRICIKIKDNGEGFKKLNDTKAKEFNHVSEPSTLSKVFRPKAGNVQSSQKSREKNLFNKSYIFGGLGVGLSEIENHLKTLEGSLLIKNRKNGGASIEMNMPFVKNHKFKNNMPLFCTESQYDEKSSSVKICRNEFEQKDALWNQRTRDFDSVFCSKCEHVIHKTPFTIASVQAHWL